MNIKRLIATGRKDSISYAANWTDLPPSQAGLAAALRRAFETPADETSRKFEELLSSLA